MFATHHVPHTWRHWGSKLTNCCNTIGRLIVSKSWSSRNVPEILIYFLNSALAFACWISQRFRYIAIYILWDVNCIWNQLTCQSRFSCQFLLCCSRYLPSYTYALLHRLHHVITWTIRYIFANDKITYSCQWNTMNDSDILWNPLCYHPCVVMLSIITFWEYTGTDTLTEIIMELSLLKNILSNQALLKSEILRSTQSVFERKLLIQKYKLWYSGNWIWYEMISNCYKWVKYKTWRR